jgi:predicted metal-dependent hydrolase
MNLLKYNVVIKKSLKFKNLTLRVGKDSSLKISAPYFMTKNSIEKFILSKEDWIQSQIEKQKPFIQISENFEIPFKGSLLSVQYVEDRKKYIEYFESEKKLLIHDLTFDQLKILKKLNQWLSQECLKTVLQIAPLYCRRLGFEPHQINIRNYKNRWGSCDSKGRISFNWQMICLNLEEIEYIVAHEIAHLKHLNHSPAFYELLESWGQFSKKIHKSLKRQRNIF